VLLPFGEFAIGDRTKRTFASISRMWYRYSVSSSPSVWKRGPPPPVVGEEQVNLVLGRGFKPWSKSPKLCGSIDFDDEPKRLVFRLRYFASGLA